MKKLLYSLSMGICVSLNTLSMVFRAKDKKPDGTCTLFQITQTIFSKKTKSF